MFSTKHVDKQNHSLDNFNIYPIASFSAYLGNFTIHADSYVSIFANRLY